MWNIRSSGALYQKQKHTLLSKKDAISVLRKKRKYYIAKTRTWKIRDLKLCLNVDTGPNTNSPHYKHRHLYYEFWTLDIGTCTTKSGHWIFYIIIPYQCIYATFHCNEPGLYWKLCLHSHTCFILFPLTSNLNQNSK